MFLINKSLILGSNSATHSVESNTDDDKESDDESQSDVSEILLVPEDTSDSEIIKNMYENIKVCQVSRIILELHFHIFVMLLFICRS